MSRYRSTELTRAFRAAADGAAVDRLTADAYRAMLAGAEAAEPTFTTQLGGLVARDVKAGEIARLTALVVEFESSAAEREAEADTCRELLAAEALR